MCSCTDYFTTKMKIGRKQQKGRRQADGHHTPSPISSGLGLSISNQLKKANPQPGVGSTNQPFEGFAEVLWVPVEERTKKWQQPRLQQQDLVFFDQSSEQQQPLYFAPISLFTKPGFLLPLSLGRFANYLSPI
ncbi:hypothetical protein PTKIN_Ptkin03bG0062000 [Pterospermum kingtungense]